MNRLASALPLAWLLGCTSAPLSPPTEVVLYVDTDAPLPPAPGELLASDEHPPLFDTLRVDFLPAGETAACAGCTREIALNRTMVRAGDLSFGVLVGAEESDHRVRLRLFRTRYRNGGEPPASSSVDAWVSLPQVSAGEVVEHHIVLPTARVADPLGSAEAPVVPEPGPLKESREGTWIRREPCRGEPLPGEVCIPGGAYWMGNPRLLSTTWHNVTFEAELQVEQQRLVILSPFFLDATETTVAAYGTKAPGTGLAVWSGDLTGDDWTDFYTWSDDPARAQLPVNGVMWGEAQAHCEARGGQLPTEAQFEYVASGLRGDDYPWGNTKPDCDDAVWGRGGAGIYINHEFSCNPGDIGGVAAVGSGVRDRLVLPGGEEALDLAGNVSEWTLDDFAPQDSPCWPEGILVNPLCVDPASYPLHRTVRGGDWALPPAGLMAALRGAEHYLLLNPSIGFRCARADVPAP